MGHPIKVLILGCLLLICAAVLVWEGMTGRMPVSPWHSFSDIWGSIVYSFDFKAHRQVSCAVALDTYADQLHDLATDPDDPEIATGAVVAYTGTGWVHGQVIRDALMAKWPQYTPAIELYAWHRLEELIWTRQGHDQFELLLSVADPNTTVVIGHDLADDMMLTPQDPFVAPRAGAGDPNLCDFQVIDLPAARVAVAKRLVAKTDSVMGLLRQYGSQDPSNAWYSYLMADGYLYMGRYDDASAVLNAARGMAPTLNTDAELNCLSRFAEKAGFSADVTAALSDNACEYFHAQLTWIAEDLRRQAASADKRGDAELASSLRDAAKKLDAAAKSPSSN